MLADFAAPFEVWPENWPAFCLFMDMQTQWRMGMDMPTGLDYTALVALMDVHEVADRKAMLADVQVMEAAALKAIRKK